MNQNLKIHLNVSESEQMSNYQNASLHGGPENSAISIDTEVVFPEHVKTQNEMKSYLETELFYLTQQGWRFNIFIGDDIDTEKENDGL